jgi:hypothetical protein
MTKGRAIDEPAKHIKLDLSLSFNTPDQHPIHNILEQACVPGERWRAVSYESQDIVHLCTMLHGGD